MLETLWVGIALVMIIEGVGPMLFPKKWQRFLLQMASQPPEQLRTIGGVLVTVGMVSLLFLL
ncbi:DUF2065 domain-containing protein [Aestuariibacter sp. AA17]|uniref:DUF2065 domain-containing protein n=1 Tax=Fluctibacter corallii TaxID=2984329 RepID=A0ABT3A7P0_9ALTE|nr:DUF2065 domain-containing protein [Aestuariibacter sp. AA17]MCV2884589.1 DUF2065 domain-containing protein [Aestuariibacter sp. AA17]